MVGFIGFPFPVAKYRCTVFYLNRFTHYPSRGRKIDIEEHECKLCEEKGLSREDVTTSNEEDGLGRIRETARPQGEGTNGWRNCRARRGRSRGQGLRNYD